MLDRHGFVSLRDAEQVQRAHDVLMSLVEEKVDVGGQRILREVPKRKLPDGSEDPGVDLMFQILVAADVLCWVLEDPRQGEFGDLLNALETLLTSCGYEINDVYNEARH